VAGRHRQFGTIETGGANPHQHLAWPGAGDRQILQFKPRIADDHRAHRFSSWQGPDDPTVVA
jgi:hypothetical protein